LKKILFVALVVLGVAAVVFEVSDIFSSANSVMMAGIKPGG
jgi:hypothetical protein